MAPVTFVDENNFKDLNTSFDTDDPLLNDFEGDYTAAIEQITDFMNNTTTNDEKSSTAPLDKANPSATVQLLTRNGIFFIFFTVIVMLV